MFDGHWLISSEGFEARANKSGERLTFNASLKDGTYDKWAEFRVARAQLHERILAILAELDELKV